MKLICDECKHNMVCRFKEDAKKLKESLPRESEPTPLKVTISCNHFEVTSTAQYNPWSNTFRSLNK